VVTVRYKCARCNRTFRHYPEGVGRPDQSRRRPRSGAAITWALGLSTRSAGEARKSLGRDRPDVRAVSEQRAASPPLKKRQVRVLGLDGGQKHGIIMGLDLGTGRPFLTQFAAQVMSRTPHLWDRPATGRRCSHDDSMM
jgi:hypothetical protein